MFYNFAYTYFLYPIIYIFPAYAANGAPILFGGGKKPLDQGKKINSKRIFGNNKTVRGTAASLAAGVIIGLIEYPFFHYMFLISILLAIGANVGDLVGSFIKRQLSFKSGSSFPIMDQYGFFAFAILFAFPFGNVPNVYGIIFLIVLTGVAHISTNIGAHKLKLKKVPW